MITRQGNVLWLSVEQIEELQKKGEASIFAILHVDECEVQCSAQDAPQN